MAEKLYDLESVRLPKVGGRGLAAFVAVLEGPLGGALRGNLLRNAGVTAFRAVPFAEEPLGRPAFGVAEGGRADGPAPLPEPSAGREGGPVTAGRLARAYRDGTTDPVEVARRALAAIEACGAGEPVALGAFVAVDPDDVLRQAEASARRFREGRTLGPLDGVPVAVKDEVDLAGYPTTVGTSFLGSSPAARDATVVARLRAAGAVLLGKTNMHEIGIQPTGFNPHHGQARNPYDPSRDTGGSSSGSAAAVAAGICPVAVGADGGGSIRIPAGFCGVVGLKPTYGRVSEAGAAPLCWSVAHLGPIGATVEDVTLAYAAMAGPDPADPGTAGQPPVTLPDPARERLDGVRVGVFRPWFEHAAPEVVARCEAALEALAAAGAEVTEIAIPGLDTMRVAHAITILAEMAAAMAPYYPARRTAFGLDSRVLLALAGAFTAADYVQAQRARRRAAGVLLSVLETVDLIATPTAAVPAPPVPADPVRGESDTSTVVEIMRYAFPGNFVGLPAISVGAGYTGEGLPVGFQLMGRPWEEALLLEAARIVEAATEYRAPRVRFDLLGG